MNQTAETQESQAQIPEPESPERTQQAEILATAPYTDEEIVQDNSFTYDGYQVVRGEFFAHINEPSISFSQNKIYVNKACLKRLPDVDYVQILVNPEERKLVIRPADEDSKDAVLWCKVKGSTKNPKQMTGRVFSAMIVKLMGWNPDYRYKLLGKIIRSGNERLIVFDLTATETYIRIVSEGMKPKTSRRPVFPAEWENQFGLPVEEHRKQLQINIFDGYTVFAIREEKQDANAEEATNKEGSDSQCPA